jgi:hypothetical protein
MTEKTTEIVIIPSVDAASKYRASNEEDLTVVSLGASNGEGGNVVGIGTFPVTVVPGNVIAETEQNNPARSAVIVMKLRCIFVFSQISTTDQTCGDDGFLYSVAETVGAIARCMPKDNLG